MNKRFTETGRRFACLLLIGSFAKCAILPAQESTTDDHEDIVSGTVLPTPDTAGVKTLDDLRNLGRWENSATLFGLVTDFDLHRNDGRIEMYGELQPPDPRKVAAEKIRLLKQKLTSPDADRSQVEAELKSALNEYFIGDMRHRVRELDELKDKLAQTEARLQHRLTQRAEAVDLQLKVMLRDADGEGFFRAEDTRGLSGARPPGDPFSAGGEGDQPGSEYSGAALYPSTSSARSAGSTYQGRLPASRP